MGRSGNAHAQPSPQRGTGHVRPVAKSSVMRRLPTQSYHCPGKSQPKYPAACLPAGASRKLLAFTPGPCIISSLNHVRCVRSGCVPAASHATVAGTDMRAPTCLRLALGMGMVGAAALVLAPAAWAAGEPVPEPPADHANMITAMGMLVLQLGSSSLLHGPAAPCSSGFARPGSLASWSRAWSSVPTSWAACRSAGSVSRTA